MPTLSAFADEISPELDDQLAVLELCGLKYLDLRSMWKTGVMELTDNQLKDIKNAMDDRGISMAAVGSPIGKSMIDQPASYELDRVKRAADIAEMFEARYIRVFSFYAPEGKRIADFGKEVIDRIAGWVDWIHSQRRQVVLTLENESDIYGDIPERCEQLMQKLYGPHLVQCYDPGNFVAVDIVEPFENAWVPLKKYMKFFHLKDRTTEQHTIYGTGDGDAEKVLVDACKSGYDGFLTFEPHLSSAAQFSGFSGPERFKAAVQAVRSLCERNSITLK